ncbi:hypothetical protein NPF39_002930 [Salmonella enterica subsp. enterica serovar Uganda]|uniref:hypothetical protein n=1 Tax=Citrobacter koseri TaxID=545 RepID=UPI00107E1F5C|nr:hypothetical protein [Citrobacter koseri]EAB3870710.1 hypothetical protein [Salmonella enterica]EAC1542121.1 hypothetical protein [Salmonella enterica subsp. enterica]EBO2751076.1 hypothetical protein [Salmonella enterica subsp. enterica serovar Agona]EDE1788969.1 hypothetical protein [Salmonella enterica subsp. enterica serovar Enteritidis]EEJ6011123.1 hypothetical protein [Salmonella enterica subsp. enterica serovar Meleagridis]EGC3413814.1 hypothetical protein [Salmonella enterica subsp
MTLKNAETRLTLQLKEAEIADHLKKIFASEICERLYYSREVKDDRIYTEALFKLKNVIHALFYEFRINDKGQVQVKEFYRDDEDKDALRWQLRSFQDSLHNVRGMLTCPFMREK